MSDTKVSRRKFIKYAAGGAIIVGVAGVGLYEAWQNGLLGATTKPVDTTPFVIDAWTSIRQVDPPSDNNNNAPIILNQTYEPLVWFDKDKFTLIPWLAESWKASSDSLTYTFTLRKGIKFHDGTDLNAQAVKSSLDRTVLINDPQSAVSYLNNSLKGANAYSTTKMTDADAQAYLSNNSVEVVDANTVAIHLAAVNPVFLDYLTVTDCFIVSPDWVQKNGGVTPGKPNTVMAQQAHKAGTGPFIFDSWDAQGQTAVLARNPNYWGSPYNTGPPTLGKVVIRELPDTNTRLLNIKSGASDLTYIPPDSIFQLVDKDTWLNQGQLKSIASGVQVNGTYPTLSVRYFALNQNVLDASGNPKPVQPFKNIKVRQAMAYAFDYAGYLKATYNNFALQPNGCVAKGEFGYDASIPAPVQNLDMAKQLLLSAGQDMGFSQSNPLNVTVWYFVGSANGKNATTILASAVNALNTGFVLTPNSMPAGAFFTANGNGQLEAWVLGWPGNFTDASEHVGPFGDFRRGAGTGIAIRAGYNNPNVISLIDQQAAETDSTKRANIISQIVKAINNDYAYIFLDQPSGYFTIKNNVQGWSVNIPTNIVWSNFTAGIVYLYPVGRK
ncbi:MAG: ABC transporter substrate-binding protein [Thaumarchaeota archaeon]|nr:ABC transporter substrate-binding protein [Nitrososphaerota archaeon]